MKTTFLFLLCSLMFCQISEAQLLNNVLKRAQNQIVDDISESLVDKAAEEITMKLLDTFYDKMDSIYYDAYEQDSVKGKYKSYPNFIASMDRSEEVPESYSFDFIFDIETTSDKDKPQYHQMLFNKENNLFGIKMDDQLVVWDNERELMITYDLKDKTAFAMGNVMKIAGLMISDSMDEELDDYEIHKTGKTKNILGYHCEEYEGKSDKHKFASYLTQEIPVNWYEGFGGFLENMHSEGYNQMRTSMDGMVLESDSYSDGKSTTYRVTSIDETENTLEKSDYYFNKQYKK